eukprot:m.135887 g.135887  ORF g.135887 m.135887 type:complete len:662 (+) comp11425_c0_seq1:135-2120(+)
MPSSPTSRAASVTGHGTGLSRPLASPNTSRTAAQALHDTHHRYDNTVTREASMDLASVVSDTTPQPHHGTNGDTTPPLLAHLMTLGKHRRQRDSHCDDMVHADENRRVHDDDASDATAQGSVYEHDRATEHPHPHQHEALINRSHYEDECSDDSAGGLFFGKRTDRERTVRQGGGSKARQHHHHHHRPPPPPDNDDSEEDDDELIDDDWGDGNSGVGAQSRHAARRSGFGLRKGDSIGIAGSSGPKISAVAGMLSLVRASVGPGAMALPYAFSRSGIGVGLLLLTVFTVIIYTNMRTLVRLKRRLPGVRTYGDVGQATLGSSGRAFVEVSLTGMELGICTVYFSYISTNLGAAIGPAYTSDNGHRQLMVYLLPVLVLFGLITRMRIVAAMSSAANVLMAGALLIVWFYLTYHMASHGPERHDFGPRSGESHQILLTLATIIYSFEGCGAVLPIENAMRKPERFLPVLNGSFGVFFVVYLIMGVLGALAFDYHASGMDSSNRGSVSAVISYYFPTGDMAVLSQVLNGLLAVTVAMTYPIQFYAAIEVIEYHCRLSARAGHRRVLNGRRRVRRGVRIFLRAVIVTMTMVLAYAIPKLSLIIALFGALFGGLIELVLPPLLVLWDPTEEPTARERMLNCVLLVVGLTAVVGGAVQAVINIVHVL